VCRSVLLYLVLSCLLFTGVVLASQVPERPDQVGQATSIKVGYWRKFCAESQYISGMIRAICRMPASSPDLLALMLYNPVEVLKLIKQAQRHVSEQIKSCRKIDLIEHVNEYTALIQQLGNLFPLACIVECTLEGNESCMLSRYRSYYRQAYEDRIVAALCTKIDQAHGAPVYYTSFGSGGLFQDAVILTKVLAQKPDAALVVNFIDPDLYPLPQGFPDVLAIINHDYSVKTFLNERMQGYGQDSTDMDVKSTLQKVEELDGSEIITWQKKHGLGSELSHDEFGSLICKHFDKTFANLVRLREIVLWLTNTFSHAHLMFYVYNCSQHYIDYLTEKNISYPDVLTAVDILDDSRIIFNSEGHYCQLCSAVLRKKPSAYNLWLDKILVPIGCLGAARPVGVEFITLSLDACAGAIKKNLKNDDGSEFCIYKTTEKNSSEICHVCGMSHSL